MMIRAGDIILTRGSGPLSRAIRLFTRRIGESRTKVNHVGIAVTTDMLELVEIVEALSTVKRHRLVDSYGNRPNQAVAIYRPNIPSWRLDRVVEAAHNYVGREYGYLKIAAHLADWGLQGAYVFRRLTNADRYPICSWLVAASYEEAGIHFGVAAGAATPDDIWDWVTAHPAGFTCVRELRPL